MTDVCGSGSDKIRSGTAPGRPSLFRWVTAPGLAALLAALTSNLLFRWLKDSGVSLLAGGAASLLFGGVLYLAALSAQGVYLSQVFRLRK